MMEHGGDWAGFQREYGGVPLDFSANVSPLGLPEGVREAVDRALGEAGLRLLLALKRADNLAQAPAYRERQAEIQEGEAILDKLLAEDACFSLRQLAVRGGDLLALGLSGPAVGEALDWLLGQVVDGALPNEREALLGGLQRRGRGEKP